MPLVQGSQNLQKKCLKVQSCSMFPCMPKKVQNHKMTKKMYCIANTQSLKNGTCCMYITPKYVRQLQLYEAIASRSLVIHHMEKLWSPFCPFLKLLCWLLCTIYSQNGLNDMLQLDTNFILIGINIWEIVGGSCLYKSKAKCWKMSI